MRTPRKAKKRLKKNYGCGWGTLAQYIDIYKKINNLYTKGDTSNVDRNKEYGNLSGFISMRLAEDLIRGHYKSGTKTYIPK